MNANLAKRIDLATRKDTPPEIFAELAYDEDEEVRSWVFDNFSCPSEILDVFATDSDLYTQQLIAKNWNTSATTLAKLSRHPEKSIRIRVAYNPRTPPEVITELAKNIVDDNDSVDNIRRVLEHNPNTPPLVKVWLQTNYGEMSLKDFLEASCPTLI